MSKEIGPANLSEVKIDATHCYCCGEVMTSTGDLKKSLHHAIPKQFKPKRNILLPICVKCHRMIHSDIPEIRTPKIKKGFERLKNYSKQFTDHLNNLERDINGSVSGMRQTD